jgi:hypothetical protein
MGTIQQVNSTNGIAIRLTDERWVHITENHCEMAGLRLEVLEAVADPDRVLAGNGGEVLAVKEHEPGKHIVVAYREADNDGFVITAFLTRRAGSLERRKQLWP